MWHHHPGLYQLFDDGTNLSSSPGAAVLLSACHDRGGSSRAPALPSYWPRSCAREPRKVLPAAECVVPVHIQELKKRGPGEPLRQPTGSRSGEDAVTGTPRRSGGPRRGHGAVLWPQELTPAQSPHLISPGEMQEMQEFPFRSSFPCCAPQQAAAGALGTA